MKMKRFNIMVFFYDGAGRKAQRIEKDVKATSRQELINLYAQCGEKIKILDEFDEGPVGPSPMMKQAIEMTKANMPDHVDNSQPKPPEKPPVVIKPKYDPNMERHITSIWKMESDQPPAAPKVVNPPRYFTIGGVEIKDDNGQLYQRQWIRISPAEEANYRVVSDSTNKIIPLMGKHIEKKVWVPVESEEETPADVPVHPPKKIRVKRPAVKKPKPPEKTEEQPVEESSSEVLFPEEIQSEQPEVQNV